MDDDMEFGLTTLI